MTTGRVRVGEVLRLQRIPVDPDPMTDYVSIGIRSFGKGIFHYEPVPGDKLGKLRFFGVEPDRLMVSNIKGWEGAVAVSASDDDGCIASSRFLAYVPIDERIDVRWARWFFLSELGNELLQRASPGSADRNRTLAIDRFEALEIPLPPIDEQRCIAARLDQIEDASDELRDRSSRASELAEALVASAAIRLDMNDDAKRRHGWDHLPIGVVVEPSSSHVSVEPADDYLIAGIYSFGRGLIDRGSITGTDTSYTTLTRLAPGDIVVSKLNGWEGAVAVVDESFAGYHVSSEYPTFRPDRKRLLPEFFAGIARAPSFWNALNATARGSMVRRRRINPTEFLATPVWLPPVGIQARVARVISRAAVIGEARADMAARIGALLPAALNKEFAGLS